MFSSGWAGASAESPEAGRRRAPLSCGSVGVVRPHRFLFPPALVSFQFRFPLASQPSGSRPASQRFDGQRAMAQASVVGEVTQVLCAAGGALELEELRRRLRDGVGAEALPRLLRDPGRFVVTVRRDAGGAAAAQRVVLAVSALRLCRAHQGLKSACVGLCSQLHLCKFMVYGTCKFMRAG